jgi:hypothetical protein
MGGEDREIDAEAIPVRAEGEWFSGEQFFREGWHVGA